MITVILHVTCCLMLVSCPQFWSTSPLTDFWRQILSKYNSFWEYGSKHSEIAFLESNYCNWKPKSCCRTCHSFEHIEYKICRRIRKKSTTVRKILAENLKMAEMDAKDGVVLAIQHLYIWTKTLPMNGTTEAYFPSTFSSISISSSWKSAAMAAYCLSPPPKNQPGASPPAACGKSWLENHSPSVMAMYLKFV